MTIKTMSEPLFDDEWNARLGLVPGLANSLKKHFHRLVSFSLLALGTIADLVCVYPAFEPIRVLLSTLQNWKKS